MRKAKYCLLLAALCSQVASADTFGWSFTAVPQDIAGLPDSTIGWGYQIVNLDPDFWLSTTALDADLFQFADPLNLFDFPILAPGASIFEPYDPVGPFGLYQLTWDSAAPLGFVNSGSFVATADFYIGNPLNGGVILSEGSQRESLYTATVGSAVPEPRLTLLLMSCCLAFGFVFVRHSNRARNRAVGPETIN